MQRTTYTKDCPLKEKRNTLEEAYYIQLRAPYQPAGQYRAAGPGFYQCNNRNSSYPDQRQTLEETLTKFMAESAKRHKENSNIIKEIRASTDAVIRNQGASIKTLEIQIGQMSKVLQERRIGGLPGLTEPNPMDHVKSISTTKVDSSEICRMGCSPYIFQECMTRSSTKDLLTPFEEPERVFHSTRKLFKTTSLDYSSLPEFNLLSDPEISLKKKLQKQWGNQR
nr:hypothetical protein [Tanacetum cinerariifolium]